jgi:hypothetical protein
LAVAIDSRVKAFDEDHQSRHLMSIFFELEPSCECIASAEEKIHLDQADTIHRESPNDTECLAGFQANEFEFELPILDRAASERLEAIELVGWR